MEAETAPPPPRTAVSGHAPSAGCDLAGTARDAGPSGIARPARDWHCSPHAHAAPPCDAHPGRRPPRASRGCGRPLAGRSRPPGLGRGRRGRDEHHLRPGRRRADRLHRVPADTARGPALERAHRALPRRLERRGLRSEEHTSELQSRLHLVCRLLLEKKKKTNEPKSPLHIVCHLLIETKKTQIRTPNRTTIITHNKTRAEPTNNLHEPSAQTSYRLQR